jgi:polar amino acid transport system permease protein
MHYVWDFGFIWQNIGFILEGLLNTILLALYTLAIGAVAGMGIVLMRIGKIAVLRWLALGFVEFFRNTPPLVQLLWLYYALPIFTGVQVSAFTAALAAFSLYSAAYVSEIYRSGINAVPRGQWEAASSIGMLWGQQLRLIIVPQMLRQMAPAFTNQLIDTVKLTSIASLLPYMELVYHVKILADQNYRPLEAYTSLALFFALVLIPFLIAARVMERRLTAGSRKGAGTVQGNRSGASTLEPKAN